MIISIEGTNGVGKTSVAKALAKQLGYEYARLPGESEAGEKIRAILANGENLDRYTKFFLYLADMTETFRGFDPDKNYVLDRSDLSTRVYQSLEGIDPALIDLSIKEAGIKVDQYILLTVSPEVAAERLEQRETKTLANYKNRDAGFYAMVQEKYLELHDGAVIDTSHNTIEETLAALDPFLPQLQ